MSELAEFVLGDNVVVPWGLDEVHGRVVSTTVRGDGVDVDVAVKFPDSDEAEIITVPAERVHPLEEPERDRHAMIGGWLRAYRFEQGLAEALQRVLQFDQKVPEITSNFRLSRREADFVTQLADGRTMFVEAKLGSGRKQDLYERAIEQVRSMIREWRKSEAGGSAVGLVVFNELPASNVVSTVSEHEEPIAVAGWRGPEDDPSLARAVRQLVGAEES